MGENLCSGVIHFTLLTNCTKDFGMSKAETPENVANTPFHQTIDVQPGGSFAQAIEQFLEFACKGRMHAIGFVLIFSFACFLPGFFSIPPVDRDEARFAQASKQMIESRDFVDIRLQDDPRHKKPVGIYWMQAASAMASGQGEFAPIWVYRLPSLLGAVLATLLTFFIGERMGGTRLGLLSACALASCILLGVEARLAKTDAMLLATILACQFVMFRLFRTPEQRLSLWETVLFWGGLGAGILIKGPLALMIIILTILAASIFSRSAGWLRGVRPLLGLPLMLAIALPWYVAITLQTDWAFFHEAIGKDLLGKVASGKESHGAPPGVYLLSTIGTFWPIFPLLVISAPLIWKSRSDRNVQFLLAWIIPAWLIFELIPTKLPHYILPLFPAMVLLVIMSILSKKIEFGKNWHKHLLLACLVALPLILGVAAFGGTIVLGDGIYPSILLLAITAAVLGWSARSLFLARARTAGLVLCIAAAPLVYMSVHGIAFPNLNKIWLSNTMVEAARSWSLCKDVEIASVDYHEPSLVFLAGTDTYLTDSNGAAAFLREAGCRVVFVPQEYEPGFLKRAKQLKLNVIERTRVQGVTLNGGDALDIGLYVLREVD